MYNALVAVLFSLRSNAAVRVNSATNLSEADAGWIVEQKWRHSKAARLGERA